RTIVINIGTALHRECIAMELTNSPGWLSKTFRAIQHWPANMPLWAEWEELCRRMPGNLGATGSASAGHRVPGVESAADEPPVLSNPSPSPAPNHIPNPNPHLSLT